MPPAHLDDGLGIVWKANWRTGSTKGVKRQQRKIVLRSTAHLEEHFQIVECRIESVAKIVGWSQPKSCPTTSSIWRRRDRIAHEWMSCSILLSSSPRVEAHLRVEGLFDRLKEGFEELGKGRKIPSFRPRTAHVASGEAAIAFVIEDTTY
jgi:hypothetical protein